MSVRYGFTIEIYRFTHSLCTSLARAAHDAIAVEVEDSRTEDDRISPEIWKTLKQRMKDDNDDKKQLVCQHPSHLLRSLTRERGRWRTARCRLDSALSFTISNFPHARCEAQDAHAYT